MPHAMQVCHGGMIPHGSCFAFVRTYTISLLAGGSLKHQISFVGRYGILYPQYLIRIVGAVRFLHASLRLSAARVADVSRRPDVLHK